MTNARYRSDAERMPEHYAYEVAFSFLTVDEPIAVQLHAKLKGRLSSFYYADADRQTPDRRPRSSPSILHGPLPSRCQDGLRLTLTAARVHDAVRLEIGRQLSRGVAVAVVDEQPGR